MNAFLQAGYALFAAMLKSAAAEKDLAVLNAQGRATPEQVAAMRAEADCYRAMAAAIEAGMAAP